MSSELKSKALDTLKTESCLSHDGCATVQRNHFDRLVAAFIHALDDFHDAADVAGAIRDDEYISTRIGRQMTLLRDQRPQQRHQLGRADVLDGNDLGDDLVGFCTHAAR
jgi:hypothetical protein